MGIFCSVVLLGFACFFIVLPLKRQKESRALIDYFKASWSFPLGTIHFNYDGFLFRISRFATGGGTSGIGGSYPVLWCYTSSFQKLMIGNVNSSRYVSAPLLFRAPSQNISIENFEFIIQSPDQILVERVKLILKNDLELSRNLSMLFKAKFAYLKLSTEFHVFGFFIRKKWVLRFIGLSDEIYKNPSLLKTQLTSICSLMKKLDIQRESANN